MKVIFTKQEITMIQINYQSNINISRIGNRELVELGNSELVELGKVTEMLEELGSECENIIKWLAENRKQGRLSAKFCYRVTFC